jgi:DNA repair exonuclease SbcCD ATPase subunit
VSEPIHLRDIALSNFRNFAKARLTLPPGPSVTVLVGPNGLGKTTLIESIEWALTGRIRRLETGGNRPEEIEAALSNEHSGLGSHYVELRFRLLSGFGVMNSPQHDREPPARGRISACWS